MKAARRFALRTWAAAAVCGSAAVLAWAQPEPVTMPAEKVKPAPPAAAPAVPATAAPKMPVDGTGTPMPATAPPPGTPGGDAGDGGDGGPLVRTDMRHRCGGIGSDESTAMRGQMKDHPLSLLLAAEGGAYLADVDITIKGPGAQPAMMFRASGPVCLVDLPPGSYEVQASRGGVTHRESATVGGAPKTIDFRF